MNATITLKQYLEKNKTFVIPDYQRGYVWGKNRYEEKNSVEKLLDDLVARFKNDSEVFLQGFTVTEKADKIILIDGQQRTTCLYLIFKWLGYKNKFDIQYEIRNESNVFLSKFDLDKVDEDPDEKYQDIFFFKKTIRIIKDRLQDIDKEKFLSFLLDKVKFLYINVEDRQAIKIFSMMNGSRAEMQQEEIIKAEMLRVVSLCDNETLSDYAREWEQIMLRSRYAREWDKWVRWWNNPGVQSLFKCQNNMGLLLTSYLNSKKDNKLTFESFKAEFLSKNQPIEAKQTFEGLRNLQKKFEDAYNDPIIHNRIGAIMCVYNEDNRQKFIQYYFVEDKKEKLEDYYKLAFLGMTHDEITNNDNEKFAEKYDVVLNAINDDYIFMDDSKKDIAYKILLRLNVDQDIYQKRNFDFKIWDGGIRSLEHIMPKSKVGHKDQDTGQWKDGNDNTHSSRDDFSIIRDDIKFDDAGNEIMSSEHSIGNLVLLYKDENSKFNNSDFFIKKELFFNPQKNDLIKSRNLLHTICVFAETKVWDGPAIAKNKIDTIRKFKEDYCNLRKDFKYEKQD